MHLCAVGVSSFGTNAHIVVTKSKPSFTIGVASNSVYLFCVSARNSCALLQHIQELLNWITTNPNVNILDLCHSLNSGRDHFTCRKSFVSDNLSVLMVPMKDYIESKQENTIAV